MPPKTFVNTNVEDWAKSEAYHAERLIPHDPILEEALKSSKENGLPEIQVSATVGKYLHLVARAIGAQRILEVGTLGGYSTIWLARALPDDGKLISLELSEKHANVARQNIERAGLSNKVEVKVGPAADTLKNLTPDKPFDLVFIDADKPSNLTYYLEAKRLSRDGAVLIVDNVVRGTRTATDPKDTQDPNVLGVRKLLEHLRNDKEVGATTLALAGGHGLDGLLFSVKQ